MKPITPPKKRQPLPVKVVCENRKARFNYEIGEVIEAGIVLQGTEVKSLRMGKANIAESYATPQGNEIWLINSDIAEYVQANQFNHDRKRPRKLLLNRRQVNRLIGAVNREGISIIPLKLYFNSQGRAKIEIALGKGKQLHDKRATERERDWGREKQRVLKG